MKNYITLVLLCCAFVRAYAQTTSFTYQGLLSDSGNPADGVYDLTFTLFSASSGGNLVAGPVTNSATAVSNGLFTATLDFGTNAFPGADRWLEIGVRTNGAGLLFTALSSRQKITSTPYALTARTVTGVLPGAGLSGTYGSAVTFSNAGNSFTGSGSGLTSVNAATLGGLNSSQFWRITGNSGTLSTHFLGTTDNAPLEFRINSQRALRIQPGSNTTPSIIAGSAGNAISNGVAGATIAGGDRNVIESFPFVESHFAVISGGSSNRIATFCFNSVIGGGFQNSIEQNGYFGTIAGGFQNQLKNTAFYGAIAGGRSNIIDFVVDSAAIGGGSRNYIGPYCFFSGIGSGESNLIQSNSQYSAISGGWEHRIGTNAFYGHIGGGQRNQIIYGWNATIAGGGANMIEANSGAIGGGTGNGIRTNADHAAIGGGDGNTIQTNANHSVIAGGLLLEIQNGASTAFIGGGANSRIGSNASSSSIVGGAINIIDRDADSSFIGGGQLNTIGPAAERSVIGGGDGNIVRGQAATIGGGALNTIQTNCVQAVIAGGGGNEVAAGAASATIGGGLLNVNSGPAATIGGGSQNSASGQYATVPGGAVNVAAGQYSFAAGLRAQANHNGSFVWADSLNSTFFSTGSNQFIIRASGGVGIGTAQPQAPLHINGDNTNLRLANNVSGMSWNIYTERHANPAISGNLLFFPNTGVYGFIQRSDGNYFSSSDVSLKQEIHDLGGVLDRVLQLRPVSYRFKSAPESARPTIGLIAQEVEPYFPEVVAEHEGLKALAYSELVPVAVGAIQELNQKLHEELKRRDTENAELKRTVEELKGLVNSLAQKLDREM